MTCRLAYGLRLSLMCSCQVGLFWPLGLLVLGPGIYALDNMLVTCSFGPNSPAHIVTPRPADSTGELENLSDESEELYYSSLFRVYVTSIWS